MDKHNEGAVALTCRIEQLEREVETLQEDVACLDARAKVGEHIVWDEDEEEYRPVGGEVEATRSCSYGAMWDEEERKHSAERRQRDETE